MRRILVLFLALVIILSLTACSSEKSDATVGDNNSNQSSIAEESGKSDISNLYSFLKSWVIDNGTLNGDHVYYSKSADNYGGYEDEDFSLYYWADTDTLEFCLHSVLDEEYSINFYIYIFLKHIRVITNM